MKFPAQEDLPKEINSITWKMVLAKPQDDSVRKLFDLTGKTVAVTGMHLLFCRGYIPTKDHQAEQEVSAWPCARHMPKQELKYTQALSLFVPIHEKRV